MRTRTVAAVAAVGLALATVPAAWWGVAVAAECGTGVPDFNGDGCRDLAVADPDATVDGQARAGRVNVLYSGPGGSRQLLAQARPGIGGHPEAGDRFGTVVHALRVDNDDYTDLVIATPDEAVGGAERAGIIQVVFGSADGLGRGRSGVTLRQGMHGVPGVPEAGDRFGAALAVNPTETESFTPALGFGVPGEDIGGTRNAGAAGVVGFDRQTGEPDVAAAISQNSPGIAGSAEAGDRFGAAVALFQGPAGFSCPTDGTEGFTLAVGAPGEDFAGASNAGLVHLAHDLNSDTPLSQESPGVSGAAEDGDRFGSSLAVAAYCEHDGPMHAKLAVGVPKENIGSVVDAGMVHLFATDDSELPLPQRWSASQRTPDVAGMPERGDRFGSTLALGGPWRDGAGQPVVVGVPREDIGSVADAGAVQTFGDADAAPGASDIGSSQGLVGDQPETGDQFGSSLLTSHGHLYVGAPDDVTYPTGAVHGVAWSTITGEPGDDQLFVPGSDGVPSGAARFGTDLA